MVEIKLLNEHAVSAFVKLHKYLGGFVIFIRNEAPYTCHISEYGDESLIEYSVLKISYKYVCYIYETKEYSTCIKHFYKGIEYAGEHSAIHRGKSIRCVIYKSILVYLYLAVEELARYCGTLKGTALEDDSFNISRAVELQV